MNSIIQAHQSVFTPTPHAGASAVMIQAWKHSSLAMRESYLSFVVDQWEKKPALMNDQLPHLDTVVTWRSMRGKAALWMDLFVGPKEAFAMNTQSGRQAWLFWWTHRQKTVLEATQELAPLEGPQLVHDAQRAPSLQRTNALAQFVPFVFAPPLGPPETWNDLNTSVSDGAKSGHVASWAQLLMVCADAQEHAGVLPQWNTFAGVVCDALTPWMCLRPEVLTAQQQKWWADHHDVLHFATNMGKRGRSGLVGRPECILGHMMREVIRASVSHDREINPARWDPLENAFWNACRQRWETLSPAARQQSFFLPGVTSLVDTLLHDIEELPLDADSKATAASRIQRLMLTAGSGCWPWQDDQPSVKPRLRRM